ncbi:streptomycin 6-kinase [Saccharopolyspora erythraea NRRL 2338]|uniref:Hydroxyurea phosphotransferase n=2 Tax=Saccharopolyspora erythraea TaxID=1836 RepID=A4FMA2_SACEN|nr:aminoglycoside phosphotransferase family protein [Saccharopolyspora erythraea]EQD87763.1 hydroxyurea phosphotransferase [Saccharopolyspora erythraea D]PFG98814.1 streptomycin 6-kinase [Saccharopolyspora erythraea NRRL 2338]QRK88811.1 hydroxyurea phosphotransferase [Saccharopolyspora erythraea]CAM05177.1 hydroxyurea phosphotransferase [Saccharopolyspora erythraea NRRL 2338]
MRIDVPDALVATHGADWAAALPGLLADLADRWELRPDGQAGHGMAGLVLPVTRAGEPAVLKFQPEHTAAAVAGLRAWDGRGAVRLLDHDPGSGALLLERLDASRPLSAVADDTAATRVLAGLLARLVAAPAPPGVPRLADVASAMLDQAPSAVPALHDIAERRLLRTCASAVAELVDEPGDRLLHWDLHHDNVLAGQREPWLAIDPEPLAGDPGFDLWPALEGRWDAVVATGAPERAVLRRFDLLTDVLGLDRRRAAGWTLGRVLQNALWDVEDGKRALSPSDVTIATALLRAVL